ncbi:MAG: hypothetical protein NC818_06395 [Candidatus Omnitrophica bacterium]|nr:hypothetical protein [Candidatus Omnitrophota bacterium]
MKLITILKKYKRLIRLGIPLTIPLAIYLFIYLPIHKQIKNIASEHKKYSEIVKELGISSASAVTAPTFNRQILELEKTFFLSDAESLDSISRFCYDLGLELVAINPLKKEKIIDKEKKPLTLGKKSIYRLGFKISLQGNFTMLMKFLEEVDKGEKFLILNNFTIGKIAPLDPTSDSLKLDLELEAFVLG